MSILNKTISKEDFDKLCKNILYNGSKTVTQRWLTKEQTLSYLGIQSATTFNAKVKDGTLPSANYHLGYRTPRWDREHIDAMMLQYFSDTNNKDTDKCTTQNTQSK